METERGQAFEKYEPPLLDTEIRRTLDNGAVVVSFKGKPVLGLNGEIIQFLAVKFALASGEWVTVALDEFAARALGTLIQAANEVQWKPSAMKPSGTAH